MKKIILIAFVFMVSLSFGQDWRDSLTVARNSYKSKDYEKAFHSYQAAQELAPEDVDLSEEMGQSAYKSHKYKEAESIYLQKGSSEVDKSKKAADYHNLGNTRMRRKDYQGAVEAYKESLRNNPSDSETRYNLSEAIRQLQNQSQKNQKDKDKQENENKDNKDNKNQENENNQGKENQKDNNGKPDKPSEQEGGSPKSQGEGPKLKDKAVEKKLDDLMKQEANTKRKLSGRSSDGGSSKSGKDW